MAKPLSMDLRERAVGQVLQGESVRVVAACLEHQPLERGEVVATVSGDGQCGAGQDGRLSSAKDHC